PFSPRELAARVKAILKRTVVRNPSAAEATIVAQNAYGTWFEVDEVRAAIRFHNQTLDLTRYEYLLLKTLLAQPERVFSRGQLINQV
ncbi:MAG TPA: two-component system response regulator CreB, partial [Candidatus Competibacteraceae bacterium]|nr:two-component system response regulator CreB [Candidatus Competibacteraceae bacterium]